MSPLDYQTKIQAALSALGISPESVAARRLPLCHEAQELVVAETDAAGREYRLAPDAARAWRDMKRAAREDGVVLEIMSAFRSVERQIEIVRAKLACGMSVEAILRASAPPGYSEHHTGCAVDINTPGCDELEGVFEQTEAFRWLTANAGRFGFMLSYPRNNASGFIYEPWHWCFKKAEAVQPREWTSFHSF
ncbi:MAG TPA: M15 family metallopeptidase [Paucimonas sp.]|nr:M15 family metallopeptidase [Paucimonas sp.]